MATFFSCSFLLIFTYITTQFFFDLPPSLNKYRLWPYLALYHFWLELNFEWKIFFVSHCLPWKKKVYPTWTIYLIFILINVDRKYDFDFIYLFFFFNSEIKNGRLTNCGTMKSASVWYLPKRGLWPNLINTIKKNHASTIFVAWIILSFTRHKNIN